MGDSDETILATKQELEIEKLRLEVERLKRDDSRIRSLATFVPLISVLVTVAGFGFAIYQYRSQQEQNRDSQERLAKQEAESRGAQQIRDRENAQREFMKPLLEKQLALYFEASAAAATIARVSDPAEKRKAIDIFWRLYSGPLVIVESMGVSGAMKRFSRCLDGTEACDQAEMNDRALSLATALQQSMLKSWNMKPEDFASDKFQY